MTTPITTSTTAPLGSTPFGSTRDGFGHALVAAAEKNKQIVALCADLTESTRLHWFKEKFPDRFIEVGVAEQNLLGVAAGLALAGKIPVAASYAVFSPGRSWDQLRVSICLSNLNVKIIGGHTGLTVGPDGANHQALEDIALTRVLPNLSVLSPSDEVEAAHATQALLTHQGPVYLRLGREKTPTLTQPDEKFVLGKAKILRPGKHVTIVATGYMVHLALAAAESLSAHQVEAQVISLPTIKPLDKIALIAAAKQTKCFVTVEEHQLAGGMGSAIAETLAAHYPVPIEFVGMKDRFGESGPADQLLTKYDLTSNEVVKAVWRVLERKK